MALKRTRAPFYGKRETRLIAHATAAFKTGNVDSGNDLHAQAARSIERRYNRWVDNDRRKSPRSAGTPTGRTSRGH